MKILAHTCFIGTTGFANHSRSFLTALNKYHQVKIRNTTVNNWNGYNERPHEKEEYLTDEMRGMLYQQTLYDNGVPSDHPIYSYDSNFIPDIHIVLCETDHHYYYDNIQGYKIAYIVWESTLVPDNFFKRLLSFDEVWVPSQWQKDCMIAQGYSKEKITIVPEGINPDIFKPGIPSLKEKFRFLLFGRWEYRKSTKEILEQFIRTFAGMEDRVEIICSIENKYAVDGLKTTQERLNKYGLNSPLIKIVPFVSNEEYVKYLQDGDVFVSCSRGEGYNLPLIEAMACGTPVIYSGWGGQTEFTKGRGLPIKINGLSDANVEYKHFVGQYCDPDFDRLSEYLKYAYDNFDRLKEEAVLISDDIRQEFNWDHIAKRVADTINQIKILPVQTSVDNRIEITYNDGPKVEILGTKNAKYTVQFFDSGNCIDKAEITNNMWRGCSRRWFTNWFIVVTDNATKKITTDKFNPKGRRIYIRFESSALGDSIAWIPYVEEFRKKHNCKVICATFKNDLFKKVYSEIEFVDINVKVQNIYARYDIGWFGEFGKNPVDPKTLPLQRTASDILGLEYKEIRPNL